MVRLELQAHRSLFAANNSYSSALQGCGFSFSGGRGPFMEGPIRSALMELLWNPYRKKPSRNSDRTDMEPLSNPHRSPYKPLKEPL